MLSRYIILKESYFLSLSAHLRSGGSRQGLLRVLFGGGGGAGGAALRCQRARRGSAT